MFTKLQNHLSLASALFLVMSSAAISADTRLDFQPNDSVQTVLKRQEGQAVELRLKSGEKIGGKVEKVGDKLVNLSQLTGAEFFEAVVALDDVTAVVVRSKGK
jgi:hypothetical protein